MTLRDILIFIKASFQMLSTYKFAMFSNYASMLMNLFVFVLFVGMFGSRTVESLELFGGDPIAYIIIGSIGWGYLWTVSISIISSITDEIATGTFESIFLTPASPYAMMIAHIIFGLIVTTVPMTTLLTIGLVFLDIKILGNYLIAFFILCLSILMMIGFGLIIAGLNIVLKQIGPVISAIQSISVFFCEVYVPVSVLPELLQPISKVIPFYYLMMSWRIALSPNANFEMLWQHAVIVGALGIASIASGIYTFEKGLDRARKEGTLAYY